jgi:hypothetical protein
LQGRLTRAHFTDEDAANLAIALDEGAGLVDVGEGLGEDLVLVLDGVLDGVGGGGV